VTEVDCLRGIALLEAAEGCRWIGALLFAINQPTFCVWTDSQRWRLAKERQGFAVRHFKIAEHKLTYAKLGAS